MLATQSDERASIFEFTGRVESGARGRIRNIPAAAFLIAFALPFWAGRPAFGADAAPVPTARIDANSGGLLTPIDLSGLNLPELERGAAVLRARPVTVDLSQLAAAREKSRSALHLNLFDGATFDANIERVVEQSRNRYTLSGSLEGYVGSSFTFIVHDGATVANIRTLEDGWYQIRQFGDGVAEAREIDPAQFPESPFDAVLPPLEDKVDRGATLDGPVAPTDASDVFDVMVVYTQAARAAAGGTAGMEALIDLAVDETNQIYANSLITPRIRLVHAEEVTYTENALLGVDLSRLQTSDDGYMDNVLTLRDTYGADLVSLFRNTGGDSCGVGYLWATQTSSEISDYAYCVVQIDCATGYYSFAHEMGHNMGCHHAVVDGAAQGSGHFYYSHGWHWNSDAYRSVMAYAPGTRVMYFSNPSVSYMSGATGTADANNALGINNVASDVANWRQAATPLSVTPEDFLESAGYPGGPFTPSTKEYTLQNISSSSLNWTASADVNWLDVSNSGAALAGGASTAVTVSINSNANALSDGVYPGVVTFSDTTNTTSETRDVNLTVSSLDYFTEAFQSSDNDLAGHTLILTPDISPNSYSVEMIPATSFPIDPTGGDPSGLTGINGSLALDFGSPIWPFYGTGYSVLYISRFGSVCFDDHDVDPTESFAHHFAHKRIAALHADWNPPASDTISYLVEGGGEGGGHFAATYANVPHNSQGGANNFQIAIYLDGVIKITWLDLDYTGGVSGMSNVTTGTPGDFVESDLTSYIVNYLSVTPATDFSTGGPEGGPFSPSSKIYNIENTGSYPVLWSLDKSAPWLDLSLMGGTLGAASNQNVTVSINSSANALATGVHNDTLTFANETSADSETRSVLLEVTDGTAPTLDSTAELIDLYTIRLTYSEAMAGDEGANTGIFDPANYAITPDGGGGTQYPTGVSSVSATVVELTIPLLVQGLQNVVVSGVADLAANAIDAASDTASFTLPNRDTVYVDFTYGGAVLGTLANPCPTLDEAVTIVNAGGTITLEPGTSSEILTISKACRIESTGLATIGAP